MRVRVRACARGGGTGTHGDGSFARLRNFVTGEYLDSSRQVSILSLMKTRETFRRIIPAIIRFRG